MQRFTAGIVNHRSYDDLGRCLASLDRQSLRPESVIVVDLDGDAAERERLAKISPGVRWICAPNRGYGAGANRVLEAVREPGSCADFALILNPDIELDPHFAERILAELEQRPRVALASGKLLRPGGRIIDSAGIVRHRSRRFTDRGSGEVDRGQYDATQTVFAVSGAALMLRVTALPDLEVEDEVFDEDFFAYHDETDLAWRARLLGWSALYIPAAQASHRRGWRRENRADISPEVRRHSFKNRYLELIKNERLGPLLRDLPFVVGFELARLAFAATREPSLLRGYVGAWRLAGRARHKRRIVWQRVRKARP